MIEPSDWGPKVTKKDDLKLNLLLNELSTISDYELRGVYEWCREEVRRRQAYKEARWNKPTTL